MRSFGQELESFSQKSTAIQSGLNTIQTAFVREVELGTINYNTQIVQRNVWAYDKVIAFNQTNGSVCAEYYVIMIIISSSIIVHIINAIMHHPDP